MNFYQPVEQPRKLRRCFSLVCDGLPRYGRYRRYGAVLLPAMLFIWGSAVAYLELAKPSFTSHFTLILPGSGMGSMLNVESIGQAQSSASSAFSSPTLSPTENYKRLLMAEITLEHAARRAKIDPARFPVPMVKLIDLTNLIDVSLSANSAAAAHQRALALRDSFLAELDKLRLDEAQKHETSDEDRLIDLDAKVRQAQTKLLKFQADFGLVSLDQFNSRIAGIDALREKEREALTTYRQEAAETQGFAGDLKSNPEQANLVMRVKSDGVLQKLLDNYALADSSSVIKASTLGIRHVERVQADSERAELLNAIIKRGHELTGLRPQQLMQGLDLSATDGRQALLGALVQSDARAKGAKSGLNEIRRELVARQQTSGQLVEQASRLANLMRDDRIAEAVFSSALARKDTNKEDPFASYPLVQTLEEPSLPLKPTSPSAIVALGGAAIATLFLLIATGLSWIRQPVIHRLFPNV